MKRAAEEEITQGLTIEDIILQYKPRCQEALETLFPRNFDESSISKFFEKPTYSYDIDGASKALLVPIWDMLDRGGKQWRPILCCLVAENLGCTLDLILPIASLCEMVHNGTLLVDDIEDDSKMRRGKPCSHLIFGVDQAINTGNAMYFFPLIIFREYREKNLLDDSTLIKCYELFSQELLNLHLGQGLDIHWHKGGVNPNVQEYLQMCSNKTGVLARLSARLTSLISGAGPDFINHIGRFAEAIGVAFQIQDDILNLTGEEFVKKNSCVGEDIHEGKRSLMVIHSLSSSPIDRRDRLLEILNSKTESQEIINEAINIIKQSGSIEYSDKMAKDIIRNAWENIQHLLPENVAKRKLQVFTNYLVDRKI